MRATPTTARVMTVAKPGRRLRRLDEDMEDSL